MINLFYDCYTVLNKVYGEKAFIKQAISETPIEEKNRSATVKICYGVLERDAELSYYIAALTEKSPKLPIRTLLKISMYSIKYLGKKDYAVIKNAVELTKKLGKGGASGFVNAFLRKFVTTKIDLPTETAERFSIKYSYPLFAVKELIKTYGEARAEKIIAAPHSETTLVFYDVDGEKYLTEKGVNYEKTPFYNVFSVKNFVRNADYDDGIYTFQSLGSVAICEAVASCEKILDCCAAPGGKSVRLSYKCKEVVSWDIHSHRVSLIEAYSRRMKRDNITAQLRDAKVLDESLIETFDAVLCDAPCSGLGVVADNPDIKINRTKEDVDALNKEQSEILDTVCKYVKKGGYLYYSTCSVLERENDGIIKKFLEKHADFAVEKSECPLPCEYRDGAFALLPDSAGGLGFFAAALKKI